MIGDDSNNEPNTDTNMNNDNDLYNLPRSRRRDDEGLVLDVDDFDDYITSSNDPDIEIPLHDYSTPREYTHLWDSTDTSEFVFEVDGDKD